MNLFQTLLAFHNALRSLGSTFTLLKAADVLRSDLLMIVEFFYANTTQSFKGLPHSSIRLLSIRNALAKRQKLEGGSAKKLPRPPTRVDIPAGLDRLASNMSEFLEVRRSTCPPHWQNLLLAQSLRR